MPTIDEVTSALSTIEVGYQDSAYLQQVTKYLNDTVLKKDPWITTLHTSYRLPENDTNPGPKTNTLTLDGNPWDKEISFKTILDQVVKYEKAEQTKDTKQAKLNFLKIALHQSKLRSTEQFHAVFKVIEHIVGKFSADSTAFSLRVIAAQQKKIESSELQELNLQILEEVKANLERMRLQFLEDIQKIEQGFLAGIEAIKFDYHPDRLELEFRAFLSAEYQCAKLTQGFLLALKEKLGKIAGEDCYQDLFSPYRVKPGQDQRDVDIFGAFTLAIQKFIEKGANIQGLRIQKVLAHANTQKIKDFSGVEAQVVQEMTRLGFSIIQVTPKTVMMSGEPQKTVQQGIATQPAVLRHKPT